MYKANITVPTKELIQWLLDKGYLHKSFSEASLIGLEREASGIRAQGFELKMIDNLKFEFTTDELKESN